MAEPENQIKRAMNDENDSIMGNFFFVDTIENGLGRLLAYIYTCRFYKSNYTFINRLDIHINNSMHVFVT